MHLIEAVASLIRCSNPHVPEGINLDAGARTPYEIAKLGNDLTQNNLTLWNPAESFIVTLFGTAHKPRAAVALSKAYMHYFFYDVAGIDKLMKVVEEGMKTYDSDQTRPFLILFQHMIEAAQEGHAQFKEFVIK